MESKSNPSLSRPSSPVPLPPSPKMLRRKRKESPGILPPNEKNKKNPKKTTRKQTTSKMTDAVMSTHVETVRNVSSQLCSHTYTVHYSETGERLYCLCLTQVESATMIGCDCCDDWFHFDCVGLKVEPKKFICPRCEEPRTRSERLVALKAQQAQLNGLQGQQLHGQQLQGQHTQGQPVPVSMFSGKLERGERRVKREQPAVDIQVVVPDEMLPDLDLDEESEGSKMDDPLTSDEETGLEYRTFLLTEEDETMEKEFVESLEQFTTPQFAVSGVNDLSMAQTAEPNAGGAVPTNPSVTNANHPSTLEQKRVSALETLENNDLVLLLQGKQKRISIECEMLRVQAAIRNFSHILGMASRATALRVFRNSFGKYKAAPDMFLCQSCLGSVPYATFAQHSIECGSFRPPPASNACFALEENDNTVCYHPLENNQYCMRDRRHCPDHALWQNIKRAELSQQWYTLVC